MAELTTLRENALRLAAAAIVALCNAEIERRKPPKRRGPVRGYHFVCPGELGVRFHQDGSFATGIWAVATEQAERSLAIGAYVALHNKRTELSYRQGTIKEWRELERKGKAIETGIEFNVEPTPIALPWQGEGAGEKGYYYGEDKAKAKAKNRDD